jgi:hypothetical protein
MGIFDFAKGSDDSDAAAWQQAEDDFKSGKSPQGYYRKQLEKAQGAGEDLGKESWWDQAKLDREAEQAGYKEMGGAVDMAQRAAEGGAPSAAQILAGQGISDSIRGQMGAAAGARGSQMGGAFRQAQGLGAQQQIGSAQQIGGRMAQETARNRGAYMAGTNALASASDAARGTSLGQMGIMYNALGQSRARNMQREGMWLGAEAAARGDAYGAMQAQNSRDAARERAATLQQGQLTTAAGLALGKGIRGAVDDAEGPPDVKSDTEAKERKVREGAFRQGASQALASMGAPVSGQTARVALGAVSPASATATWGDHLGKERAQEIALGRERQGRGESKAAQKADSTPRSTGMAERLPAPPSVSPEEKGFQDWYGKHAQARGLDADPDSPEHRYDYRAAHQAGVNPGPDGHWPSEFKSDDHPNRFVREDGGVIDSKSGQRVSHMSSAERLLAADAMRARGLGPLMSLSQPAQDVTSSRDRKTAIDAEYTAADAFLDHAKPYSFDYKDPADGEGRRLGVMAQDIERVPEIGAAIVRDTPRGKVLDGSALASANTAGLGRLRELDRDKEERLRALEGKSGKRVA